MTFISEASKDAWITNDCSIRTRYRCKRQRLFLDAICYWLYYTYVETNASYYHYLVCNTRSLNESLMRGVLPTIVGRTEILRMRRCISAKCIIGSCAVHAYVPDSRFVRTRNPDTRVCESLIRTKKGTKATKERTRMDNSCESRGLCVYLCRIVIVTNRAVFLLVKPIFAVVYSSSS